MKRALIWAAKAIGVWAALLAGSVAGGLLVAIPPSAPGDGPLTAGAALLVVNALAALILAAIGARMTGSFPQRAIGLFALLYATESLLSTIESLFFGTFLHLPEGMIAAIAEANAVKAGFAALAAAALWRSDGGTPPAPAGLAWKLPAIVACYVCLYFGAGYAIAWQSGAVRAYYGGGLAIDGRLLLLVQLGRGAIWAGLAWLLAGRLRGSAFARAVLAGAAFAILMAAPLLYPNAYMPWTVRQVHLVEIGVSNFLFGLLAVLLLARKGPRPAAG